jgi:HTH-type transcriptional regulator/antitoxin HigA
MDPLVDDDLGTLLPTPSEFIRRELEARKLTQADLAFILGVPQQSVNQIATGKRGISAEMAKALGDVFGVSPAYILKLQKTAEAQIELSRARPPSPSIARKTRLVSLYPVREMISRGWLSQDGELEGQIARFFGVASADEIPHLTHAAKKTDYIEAMPAAQIAWLFRVRQIAAGLVGPKYSEKALREALPHLRAVMSSSKEAHRVNRILADCGIRFVLVESLPGAKIDGVCFWLNDGTIPVIGMSLRFDRIDNFWFVVRHEIEHVLRRHGVEGMMVDDLEGDNAGVGAELPEEERLANAAASDFCVPTAQLDSWIARKAPFFSEQDMLGLAKRLQLPPGIVAGQLRNRLKKYNLFTKHLTKIRASVITSAVVDGWGEVYPIGT